MCVLLVITLIADCAWLFYWWHSWFPEIIDDDDWEGVHSWTVAWSMVGFVFKIFVIIIAIFFSIVDAQDEDTAK